MWSKSRKALVLNYLDSSLILKLRDGGEKDDSTEFMNTMTE